MHRWGEAELESALLDGGGRTLSCPVFHVICYISSLFCTGSEAPCILVKIANGNQGKRSWPSEKCRAGQEMGKEAPTGYEPLKLSLRFGNAGC